MFHFTPQEKRVLLLLVLVLLFGSITQYVTKKYPPLLDILNFIDKVEQHNQPK